SGRAFQLNIMKRDNVGTDLVKRMLETGERVVGVDKRPSTFADGHYEFIKADVTSSEDLELVVSMVRSGGRPLRRLVHCAGVYERRPADALTFDVVARALQINVLSAICWTSRLAEFMQCRPS